MSDKETWQDRYETGMTPWDSGRPDTNLTRTVIERPVHPCKTLEIGCGTGANAIWLALNGFCVTGTDISEIAIRKAKSKAAGACMECDFIAADFLNAKIPGGPFKFAFDRGCFHCFEGTGDQMRFAENTAEHLKKGGLWLSISGSTDDPPRDTGPPRRSAQDIVSAVEPHFEILSLRATTFDSIRVKAPRAWLCLMKKRGG